MAHFIGAWAAGVRVDGDPRHPYQGKVRGEHQEAQWGGADVKDRGWARGIGSSGGSVLRGRGASRVLASGVRRMGLGPDGLVRKGRVGLAVCWCYG